MTSLAERLIKNSTIDETSLIAESKIYNKSDMISTKVPMINVGLSGLMDGGLTSGLTVIAGPSKHFKSAFSLLIAAAYLQKYPDAVILYYDSEFGTPQDYFKTFGIDLARVIHTPITNIEELKFDIAKQLIEISRKDKVIIVVDSVGNLASKKEVEDALKENSAADMTRAKALKSVFRIVTPQLTMKDIPMVVVNHTYQTQELYSKAVVSGGTGIYYSASTIWIIGRQQEKDDEGVSGYNFVINVEKSRYVREKSKFPITVTFKGGIERWSGFTELSLEAGILVKPKNGWYATVDPKTGEISEKNMRLADFDNDSAFWVNILKTTNLRKFIEDKYKLVSDGNDIMKEEMIDEGLEE